MKLSDFNLLGDEKEKESLNAIIQGFNQTQTDYPRKKTVHTLFAEQAAKTPDAIAVICGENSKTYGELEHRSNQLALFLISRGLSHESIVGIMLDRSHEMIVALLGILKAGGAYLPINPDLPFKRVEYMLKDTQARFLISSKKYIRIVNKLQWECPDLGTLFCIDSTNVHAEPEAVGEMMKEDMWDYIRRDFFDDISGGGWKSSYTGEWLSREVMDEYGDNIRLKLEPLLDKSSRILEIGCASGISLFRLAPLVGLYYGTELSGNILDWVADQIKSRELKNIQLAHLAAHEIDRLDQRDFDVVIFNSVIQCFSGHNYLRDVLRKSIALMKDNGFIFLGNVWDQELHEDFVRSLKVFEKQHAGEGLVTKIDRFEELFISKAFLEELRYDLPEIAKIEYSTMLGKSKSELSEYGYDAIIYINKSVDHQPEKPQQKYQFDRRILNAYTDDAVEEQSHGDALAYVIYTSGTTGLPKGVMVEHHSISRLVVNTNYIQLDADDRILQTGSLAFDASTFEIWGALINGGAVCFPQEDDLLNPNKLGQLIQQHEITTIFLTTSLFNLLVGMNINLFQGLKTVLSGGENVSVRHFNQVRKLYPLLALKHVYGPTENTTFTTCYTVDKTFDKDIPIGTPIANTTVYILDSNGELVPIGVAGEICTGGDGLARGYLNDPILTKEKFVSHPFQAGEYIYRTGDLGRWLFDGTIEFLGRKDDQVKIRGYRIELGEIENHLLQHEAVKETVVIAKDFGPDSKELLAYVTLQEDNLDVDKLREYLKARLPDYMLPAYFTKLENLPLTPNGKVNKRALPAPDMGHQMADSHYEAPETETEKQLVLIWEQVLGHKGISVEDDFFDIGGHSLKVTKLIALIHKQMGIEIPLATVFKASTIRELAQHLLDFVQFGIKEVDEAMVHLSGKTMGPNIFALPPGTGDAIGYLQLAELFKPYDFYGFNFIAAETRLKDYADLIMSVDPEGPYLLFGYSAGGNLAYHVTKELEKRGKSVSDIVMVDSAQFKEKVHFTDSEVKKRAEQFLSHESIAPYLTSPILWEKAFRIIKRYHDYISNSVDRHIVNANIHVLRSENSKSIFRDTDPEFLELLSGENSQQLSQEGTGRVIVSLPGWAEVTRGSFKTYEGVGDHNYMLYQPHLETNFRILRDIIDRAFSSKTLKI